MGGGPLCDLGAGVNAPPDLGLAALCNCWGCRASRQGLWLSIHVLREICILETGVKFVSLKHKHRVHFMLVVVRCVA